MAKYVYPAIALTGGGTGALDAIDGAGLADKDMAYVTVGGYTYTYILDDDSAATESSPRIIAPDANGGNKRWVLQPHQGVFENAKGQMINAVYGIITPANIRLFLVFDQTGAVSTITERSTIGGVTTHVTTLRDASLNAINASTCTPGVSGLAPYLTFDATHLWNTPDAADLTFGNGSADSAFSAIVLFNTSYTSTQYLLAKDDTTTGSTNREYNFYLTGEKLYFRCWDDSVSGAYIGRIYDTALTAYRGVWVTYGFSKGTGVTADAINLFFNGVAVDDTDSSNGSYVAMENKAALVGPYHLGTGGAVEYPAQGKMAVLCLVAEELTAVQMARLDAVLRGYAGVVL
jgi:hypothetical protein